MSRRFGRLLAAYMPLVFLIAGSKAQPVEASEVKVELKSDGGLIAARYVCVLEDMRSHQVVAQSDLQADGTFTLRAVPYGDYQLTITNFEGAPIHQEIVTLSEHGPPLSVYLPKREEQRPPAGPVSVAELQHPPSRKAVAAAVAAQRYSEAGDYRRAAEELEKAVRLSPDFAEAYDNLAVQHIRLGEYQQAVAEIGRAMQIARPGPAQLCNLAYAQIQLREYGEAIETARAALWLDRNYAQAHFLLGFVLARDRRTLPEALPHLELAAQTLPSAGTVLGLARKALKQSNFGGN